MGDVVVATEVHAYESGKDAEQFESRPRSFPSAYRLKELARPVLA
jgi:hypothetical protein